MYKPKTNVTKRYAYVKNSVIFNIKGGDNGDSCAVEITNENAPQFTGDGVTYYLDTLINDGDKYNDGTFIKVIHGELDNEGSFTNYYLSLCEAQIKDVLIDNYSLEYNYILTHLSILGVPLYMIKQSGKTVQGITQINFTEKYYDNVREAGVKEIVLKAAQNAAEPYGYNVTDVTMEKGDIPSEAIVEAKINVTNASEPSVILSPSADTSSFTSIEIDGVKLPSAVIEYKFSEVGEYTVKYTLSDLTKIGDYSFCETDIASVVIPNSAVTIGDNAFSNCVSLSSVTIGNSVATIGYGAFSGCSSLSSVTIPNVVIIRNEAFKECTNLSSITSFATTAPGISNSTFQDVKTNGTLYVPQGSSGYDTWMRDANFYLGKYRWEKVEE